ncbi:tripartite tricarboxylate transporter TctB family protein [Halomonas daqiaonensis]|uniref:Tripartite tricarboxylate transporter TctB family protein n=1 Tax=Halomonas daqiaonensis TaxID=650850 RepID=A0A1H7UCL5_9GAMM|nr:tripartite tricarboxylate transporter TctB family protein [Halomonas daqiaonensis]SEL94701.1 Tripartite tricarboxylate transporter TctB family protein [Halomonas daqiaonensis]
MSRLVFGVFAIGIAAAFYVTALGYPDKAANMPLIYSVVVALLGAAMVGQEVLGMLRRRRVGVAEGVELPAEDSIAGGEDASAESGGRRKQWKAMVVFLLAALYIYTISLVGYLLATVAFMGVSLAMIGYVTWRFALVGIVLLVAMVCLVFIGFLGLPVPLLPPFLS